MTSDKLRHRADLVSAKTSYIDLTNRLTRFA
jgi:hypothetical protein